MTIPPGQYGIEIQLLLTWYPDFSRTLGPLPEPPFDRPYLVGGKGEYLFGGAAPLGTPGPAPLPELLPLSFKTGLDEISVELLVSSGKPITDRNFYIAVRLKVAHLIKEKHLTVPSSTNLSMMLNVAPSELVQLVGIPQPSAIVVQGVFETTRDFEFAGPPSRGSVLGGGKVYIFN
jgi:hypothetical protein